MRTVDQEALLIEAAHRLRHDSDIDAALRFLRANGNSVIDSIKATMQLTGTSLGQAKHTVHTSETWSDLRDVHDEFHHMAAEAIERDA